ncbi:MAG: histidine kinase dimerization/phospho-acceptor domain-containing protein, partial [Longimicrobiales bacterium]
MSLRLRLTVLAGLLTGATVLLFALFFYVQLQADLSSEIDAQLQERANLVMQTLEAAGGLENNTNLPPLSPLVEFATPGIYVELITPDGRVRASSPNLPSGHLPADPMLIAAARAGRTGIGTVTVGSDEQLRLLVASVQAGGTPGSVLLVAESLEPLQDTLAQARILLLIGGVMSLALVVGGAALLTGRALAPVARLTRAAADVATTGHYHKRVPLPWRNDEVGQLTATINELIATVDRTIGQQRQFLADTSHELRSPLTIVLANLDLLRRDLDPHERDLSIQEAMAEAQRMRRLVNDLLLLAQADAAQAIAHAPVRLDKLVEETAGKAARQAPDHVVQAQAEARVIVMGDLERLRQLLRNLLENAT